MQRQLDAWHVCVIAFCISVEVQRQHPSLKYDDVVFTKVHCLGDLVAATEALLIDVPEPHDSAVDAVSTAFRGAFPAIACPALGDNLADALRLHRSANDFWAIIGPPRKMS
jgi:hypothetical protein